MSRMVRTTINLDPEVLARARQLVPERGLSRFINDTLNEKMAQLERQRIEAAMKEGYIATRQERAELDEDWAAIDGEGWPE